MAKKAAKKVAKKATKKAAKGAPKNAPVQSMVDVNKLMNRVIHFEINADDPLRAVKFYREVFGWKIEEWPGQANYWLATTGAMEDPGINGAITNRLAPDASIVNTVQVADVDATVEKVKIAGGSMFGEKMDIPGIGLLVYVKDSEGNLVGLLQSVRNPM